MAKSSAGTVAEYLAELPQTRRAVLSALREVILAHLLAGYEEAMNWGMISYQVPLATFPETYNGQPLLYAALAAQKHHYALYLMSIYQDPAQYAALIRAYQGLARKPDLGKSCIRFRQVQDLPLDTIARLIGQTAVDDYLRAYQALRG